MARKAAVKKLKRKEKSMNLITSWPRKKAAALEALWDLLDSDKKSDMVRAKAFMSWLVKRPNLEAYTVARDAIADFLMQCFQNVSPHRRKNGLALAHYFCDLRASQGYRWAIPPITKLAASDPDEAVRKQARELLSSYAFDPAPQVKNLRSSDVKKRQDAMIWFRDTRDARSADEIAEALKDSDDLVSHLAAVTLGRMGDARAIPFLTKIKNDSDESRSRQAEEILSEIAQRKDGGLDDAEYKYDPEKSIPGDTFVWKNSNKVIKLLR